jgi:cation:H+ antiporter
MTPLASFALLGAGVGLLVLGADWLVQGASRLAISLGVTPLVVGLTVVAFGTSAPELAVSVGSAFAGQADLALGNVVGSNIFNVLVILGLAAAITPLAVAQQLVRLDVPLLVGASGLVWLLALDGQIGRGEGSLLATGIVAYTLFSVRQSRSESAAVRAEYAQEFGATTPRPARDAGLVVAGLVLLVLGSRLLVMGAVALAQSFGLSELLIGLTIVAAGTSLPEVATSVIAALRGERDIAVGNVVGSNLFNLLCVLGLTAIVSPGGVPVAAAASNFDLPVMTAAAVACLPIFFTGHAVSRGEGLLLLAWYAAYLLWLALSATGHAARGWVSIAVLGFALPLTLAGLGISLWRARSQPRVG